EQVCRMGISPKQDQRLRRACCGGIETIFAERCGILILLQEAGFVAPRFHGVRLEVVIHGYERARHSGGESAVQYNNSAERSSEGDAADQTQRYLSAPRSLIDVTDRQLDITIG